MCQMSSILTANGCGLYWPWQWQNWQRQWSCHRWRWVVMLVAVFLPAAGSLYNAASVKRSAAGGSQSHYRQRVFSKPIWFADVLETGYISQQQLACSWWQRLGVSVFCEMRNGKIAICKTGFQLNMCNSGYSVKMLRNTFIQDTNQKMT